MKLPVWVQEEIAKFTPPSTGRVTISMEMYQGGVTKLELSPTTRIVPGQNKKNGTETTGSD